MKHSRSPLRIGTRGSALAVWQTERVRSLLTVAGHETMRVEIKTTGDLAPEIPLSQIGDRSLFTRQIDDALLGQRIDLAVHSLKDLPTRLPEGLVIAAVGEREDPRDALVGRGSIRWSDLPESAVIGTSSLRRRAQLLHHRPDLRVVDLRGNVDTRLTKLDSNLEWAAIVLATAGLVRLGQAGRIGERLPPELMLPAPGQGALAVTVRSDDAELVSLVRDAVHHPVTALVVSAERALLARLGGGCQVPVAAHAELSPADRQHSLRLHGRVISRDGRDIVEGHQVGRAMEEAEAADIGAGLAERLLADGAGSILRETRTTAAPIVSEP